MAQEEYDPYKVTDPGKIARIRQRMGAQEEDPYRVTPAMGTDPMTGGSIFGGVHVPTVAEKPGMPKPPMMNPYNPNTFGMSQQDLAQRAAGTLAGFPGGSMNVPSNQKAMLPGEIALGAAGLAAAPTAVGAATRLVGQAALRHPAAWGTGIWAAKHMPKIPTPFGDLDIAKYAGKIPEVIEWGPLGREIMLAGGGRTLLGKMMGQAAEKAATEQAAGGAVAGAERGALEKQLGRVVSGEATPGELKTIAKGLRTGKQVAKAVGKAAKQTIKGSMQGGGTVPETGTYRLHRGETVVPAPLNLADPTTGRAIAAAAPGYLKGMANKQAQHLWDVFGPNMLYHLYKPENIRRMAQGKPLTKDTRDYLKRLPPEAVQTYINFATSDMPGVTNLLMQEGMAERAVEPTGKELYEMAGQIRRPTDPIPKRVGTLSSGLPELPPEVRQRMTYNPRAELAARPTFTPQTGPYQTGTNIPWSPDISRMMQQQPATINLQQALERMQKGQAIFRQGNTPFSVPISTKGTEFWGY